jgi:flagellar hook assembly protein FlgD
VSGIRFNDVNKSNQTISNVEMKAGENIVAYPNPTNATASVVVNVPTSGTYAVRVYDAFGKLVSTIFNGQITNGTFNVEWNGRDAAGSNVVAGAYMIRVEGNSFNTATMISVVR